MISWWLTAMVCSGIILLVIKSVTLIATAQPWLRAKNVAAVSSFHLEMFGVKGIIFDADNTLTAYHKNEIHPLVADSFHKLSSQFKVVVFTNSWSKKRHQELQQMFPGIPIVDRKHRKPDKAGFLEAANLLNLEPKQIVVIGDRFTTDIFGGNRVGMKTILLTEPLSDGEEPVWYPIVRWLEYAIFN